MTFTGIISQKMTSLGEKGQLWVANATAANQTGMVYSANYDSNTFQFDIILIKTPAANFNTVAVRHILIQPSSTDDDAAWKEAKEQIDTIYAQWKKKPTEEYFSTLAKEKSTDPGSKDEGGLYDAVQPGQMVDTFDAWCFDKARKTGDTDIVKTSYGYHLMYFVKHNGAYWKTQVPADMATEYVEENVQGKLDKVTVDVSNFGWGKIKEVQDYKDAQKSTTTTVATTAAAQ